MFYNLDLDILKWIHDFDFDIFKVLYYFDFVYCLLANAISGAKLVKMFEEAKFRCVKVQFFSGAVV